jgi:hypothetical protein
MLDRLLQSWPCVVRIPTKRVGRWQCSPISMVISSRATQKPPGPGPFSTTILSLVFDFVTHIEQAATENDGEKAHDDSGAGCVRIARLGGIVGFDMGLQVFPVLRVQQLQVDMDGYPRPCSRSRTRAAGGDRAPEGRREMGGVLQTDVSDRRIRRSPGSVCQAGL